MCWLQLMDCGGWHGFCEMVDYQSGVDKLDAMFQIVCYSSCLMKYSKHYIFEALHNICQLYCGSPLFRERQYTSGFQMNCEQLYGNRQIMDHLNQFKTTTFHAQCTMPQQGKQYSLYPYSWTQEYNGYQMADLNSVWMCWLKSWISAGECWKSRRSSIVPQDD